MLDQRIAKILFCGMCVTPFSNHAEYLEGSLVSFTDDDYLPLPYELGVSKYETIDQDGFYEYPSDSNNIKQSVLASYMDPPSGFKNYRQPSVPSQSTNKQGGQGGQLDSIRLGLQTSIDYLVAHNLDRTVAPGTINVRNGELANTANALINWQGAYTPEAMKNNFHLIDLVQGNQTTSKFTGYYTPTISAQLYSDGDYHYPIYKSPMSQQRLLSRKEIVSGALANKGLEIAWTNDPLGLFYMHIQGSGVLEFSNGDRKALKFDGSNEKTFVSVAKYMSNKGLLKGNPSRKNIKRWLDENPYAMDDILNINPRFIYFTLNDEGSVKTASGMPAVSGHTVAVDTDYIPFGSVILAEVPIINSLGNIVGNEWRVLLSQDRGNAIKGPARMDIYTGFGESARKIANNLTGYGRAYLLLNKPQYGQSQTASLDN